MNVNPISRKYHRVSDYVFEIHQGGGGVAIVGLPFLAAGVVAILVGLGFIPVEKYGELGEWTGLVMFLFSLPLIGVGVGVMFGRALTAFDLNAGRMIKEWRLLAFTLLRSEYNLRDYDVVVLKYFPGDSEITDTYPIALRSNGGLKEVILDSSTDSEAAHQLAVDLSKFLNFPFEDSTGRNLKVLPTFEGGRTFQERLKLRVGSLTQAVRPARLKSEVSDDAGRLIIRTPRPRFPWLGLLLAGISIAALIIFVPGFLNYCDVAKTPALARYCLAMFIILILGVLVFLGVFSVLMGARRSGKVLYVNAKEMVLEERKAFGSRQTVIPAEAVYDISCLNRRQSLEDLFIKYPKAKDRQSWWYWALERLTTAQGFTIKSRPGVFHFGAGLSDDELAYLNALIIQKLTWK